MYRTYGFTIMLALAVSSCASSGSKKDSVNPPSSTPVATTTSGDQAGGPLSVPAPSAKHLVLSMTGPSTVTEAKDWSAFQKEWRDTFADHAKDAHMAFDVQAGDAHPTGDAGTLLEVYVNDYRMIGIGSRIFFGVMTGNAYIDAKATYVDLNNGSVFGMRLYNTSSTAWAGVFAKMTPQQVDSIASQVFAEMAAAH